MNLTIDTEYSNDLISKLFSAAGSYASKLQDPDQKEFSNYLKDNFGKIDTDQDGGLSKKEIMESLKDENLNPNIQKIVENRNIESIIANIDNNADNVISMKEVTPSTEIEDVLKSTYNELRNSRSLKTIAGNLAYNVTQAYNNNPEIRSFVNKAVDLVL